MAKGDKLSAAEMKDRQDRADLAFLIQRREFTRFLSRVIQSAGIYRRTTDGSQERDLSFYEGRRHLGLDILDMVEAGQPVVHPHEPMPILTLIQIHHEDAQPPTPPEKNDEEHEERYDRNAELDDGGDDDDPPDRA